MKRLTCIILFALTFCTTLCADSLNTELRVHRIFSSHMVLQRDKPIVIWGWAAKDSAVSVQLGDERATTTAIGDRGRWEVSLTARSASPTGVQLTVSSGDASVVYDDILVGDVWVMSGQSNMAWALGKSFEGDFEVATANRPLLRNFKISTGEMEYVPDDLAADKITGWTVCSPATAANFSAIGYVFASRLVDALQIPIGIIDNSRGGASLESFVPRHSFANHPDAARYLAWVDERRESFDWDAAVQGLVTKWEKEVADKRAKGEAEDKLPPRPTRESLRSWNIPGRSPSDAASIYNGAFAVFHGLSIKGVMFHQGYNNAMHSVCRPKRYQLLLRLMVEGWRKDFNDPHLPVGVIEFCAGGDPQHEGNFEFLSDSPAAYIREAQRLGLAELNDPKHTVFIPGYDEQVPGLHPKKKHIHELRAARWALKAVYGLPVEWEQASLVSHERQGDRMVLTFDKPVFPHTHGPLEGFSLAGEDGKYYIAYAESLVTKDQGYSGRKYDRTKVYVWSPMVSDPVGVRYAWSSSPLGNLMVNGLPWQPVQSFRTDAWDWPETNDPEVYALDRAQLKQRSEEAVQRLEARLAYEAQNASVLLERRKTLGIPVAPGP